MTATQSLNLYSLSLKHFKNEADAILFVKEIETVIEITIKLKKKFSI